MNRTRWDGANAMSLGSCIIDLILLCNATSTGAVGKLLADRGISTVAPRTLFLRLMTDNDASFWTRSIIVSYSDCVQPVASSCHAIYGGTHKVRS